MTDKDRTAGRAQRERLLVNATTQLNGVSTDQQRAYLALYRRIKKWYTYPRLITVPDRLRRVNGGLLEAPLLKPRLLIGPRHTYAMIYPRIPVHLGSVIIMAVSRNRRSGHVRFVSAHSRWAFIRGKTTTAELGCGDSLPGAVQWRIHRLPQRWPSNDTSYTAPICIRQPTHEYRSSDYNGLD